MAEAVKVIVRCRPMNTREKDLKCKNVVLIDTKTAQCCMQNPGDKKAPPKSFTFDGSYGIDSTTEQIYADIGYPLVEGVTEGYNGTIFAYGQTGCGKSFSMQGITDPATQRGIIPRAFDHIFETIQVTENSKYLVHATYLEIYNEEIRDLLGKDVKAKKDLKEHPDKGVYVQDLSMHPCKSVADCEHIMAMGWKNRSTGATLMNADSSRSHSIFTIHLERCDADDEGEEHIRAAKLNLVDLAGSERQGKTGATGDRLKEATKINLSLSALGNVISALVDGKSKHIPYRDSKLTRLLQDSLGGNTKTLMVACLSPADNNYDETLSTLRYANRAKNIKNKPKINEDPKDALLREFQEEITKLKAMLRGEIPINLEASANSDALKPSAGGHVKVETKVVEKIVHVGDAEAIEAEKTRIKEEYDGRIAMMKAEYEEMKLSKEAVVEEMSRLRQNYDMEIATVEERVQHLPSPGQQVAAAGAAGAVVPNGEAAAAAADHSGAQMFEEEVSLDEKAPDSEETQAEVGEEEDVMPSSAGKQRAVHVSTVKRDGGLMAPTSSPTGEHKAGGAAAEEALKRLQQLQEAMVGGELAQNEEIKEKRKRKKKYAEDHRIKLAEALAKIEDDGTMLTVFENVQDEVKAKNKIIDGYKQRLEATQNEVADLQSEFEFDRIDYLDTIRRQERQMKLLQAILDKIHPCLRRDCNYVNLDRVKAQCEWDEEGQSWSLPKMTIEKTKLPPAGVMPGGRDPGMRTSPRANGSLYDDLQYEDRFLHRLNNSQQQDIANNYFRNTRADKLLSKTQDERTWGSRNISPNQQNGHSPGATPAPAPAPAPAPWQPENLNQDMLRAAQVHGQLTDEFPSRKPQRLSSLLPAGGKPKKKKKQLNMMEQI